MHRSNVLVRMVTETGLVVGKIAERMALSGIRSTPIVDCLKLKLKLKAKLRDKEDGNLQ